MASNAACWEFTHLFYAQLASASQRLRSHPTSSRKMSIITSLLFCWAVFLLWHLSHACIIAQSLPIRDICLNCWSLQISRQNFCLFFYLLCLVWCLVLYSQWCDGMVLNWSHCTRLRGLLKVMAQPLLREKERKKLTSIFNELSIKEYQNLENTVFTNIASIFMQQSLWGWGGMLVKRR